MKGNTVSIIGNCTRDAEVKRTQSGNNAVKWGIAWNSSKKDGDNWVDVPHYFDVECWMTDAQLNNVAPRIVKGAGCCVVDGHLEYQSWTDENGNKRSKVVVRVDDPIRGIMFTAPRQRQDAPSAQYQAQPQGYAPQPQNTAYMTPQPAQVANYAPPQGYAYGQAQPAPAPVQQQGFVPQQAPAQAPMQAPAQAAAGLYDDDIPF